ncbi:MAG TPA: DUF3422 domain-containing protein [Gammaproteobacteria bacterium]|nr:DUF3422 domain-containing protein [Gammaproteobacteria bacterium]
MRNNPQDKQASVLKPLQSKVIGLPEYGMRFKLHGELHGSPYELLTAPMQISHIALFSGRDKHEQELQLISQLCDRYSESMPSPGADYFNGTFGSFRMKWERHGEFSSYTFYVVTSFDSPFGNPAIRQVPEEWLKSLPGEIIAAAHVAFEDKNQPIRSLDELIKLFSSNTVVGAEVAAGSAYAWTDNKIHADGFGRILVRDVDLRRRQAGRLVKRLLDIETYRILAMMPVPLAKKYIPKLAIFDRRLAELTEKNTKLRCLADEQRLLDELNELSAEIESISAATNHRFSASLSYYKIVQLRVSELREQRIKGLQMFHEFMEQRLAASMNSCEAVHLYLEKLSTRVSRASGLLRARIDIAMEEQTSDLLRSMDNRADLQLRLQETVEGLSIVVLSYYLLGIVGYCLKAIKAMGVAFNVEFATGIAIPFVFLFVFFTVRKIKRSVTERGK